MSRDHDAEHEPHPTDGTDNYRELQSNISSSLNLTAGLDDATERLSYGALTRAVAEALDVDAGLQDALDRQPNPGPPVTALELRPTSSRPATASTHRHTDASRSGSAVRNASPVSTLSHRPMGELVEALRELHRAAGILSTRAISEMIRERHDLRDSVSHETVGMMLRGTRLIGWTKLQCVVQLLAERSVNPVFEPSERVRRFHELWLSAKDSVTSESPTALQLSPASVRADLLHPLIKIRRQSSPPSRISNKLLTNLGERNQAFVGRTQLHQELDRLLQTEPRLPVVLSGPGGVGKSQLAIEYAHRSINRYDLIWFISAEDGFGAHEMLAELAGKLHIRPEHHRERTMVSVLRAFEQRELRWMLIFDNATPEIPLNTPDSARGGDIIITTRAAEWQSTSARLLPVDVLTRSESVRYLRAADDEISETDADGLADMLGDLPLALAQLAATREATGMPLTRYLELYQRHVQELISAGRAQYYPASLSTTIKMSIEQLNTRGAALLLIELFAHFGADPVPWTLLHGGRHAAVTDALRRCIDDPLQLRASLNEIAGLGLIKIEADARHAVMHRLVRLALRENLGTESLCRGRDNAHALLAAANPKAPETPSTWPDHALLTPHILPSVLVDAVGPPCRATVLDQIRYLHQIGDYERSKAIAEAAIASWSAAPELGAKHESTLLAIRHLANALRELGQFTQARSLYESIGSADDHEDPLDDESDAVERVRSTLERDYVRTVVADTLAELGYVVDHGFATVESGRMRLVRPDWGDHAALVMVEGATVRATLVRLAEGTGENARRQDVERSEQLRADLDKLLAILDAPGRRSRTRTARGGKRAD